MTYATKIDSKAAEVAAFDAHLLALSTAIEDLRLANQRRHEGLARAERYELAMVHFLTANMAVLPDCDGLAKERENWLHELGVDAEGYPFDLIDDGWNNYPDRVVSLGRV